MAQDGVISTLYGWVLRVSSLHTCACFRGCWKTGNAQEQNQNRKQLRHDTGVDTRIDCQKLGSPRHRGAGLTLCNYHKWQPCM